ncbi:MAG TPA: ABC transporter permease [Thermoanaerobaculia bacterium]|nr:ABC transporter permease [Thermoanaerobaculia bacterium]
MKRDRETAATLLGRALLRAYPRRYRDRFGDDLLATLEARTRETDAGAVRIAFLARCVLSLLRAAVAERVSPSLPTPKPPSHRGKARAMDLSQQDFRYALRSLLRRPGFLVIALLTLAIGVGANTAIFSVVDAVLLRPLPYDDPDSLVQVERVRSDRPGWTGNMSQPDLEDLGEQSASLDQLEGYQDTSVALTGDGAPELVEAAAVTGGLLSVFRLAPALGRDLTREDNVPDGPRVVVVSHRFWLERLGGDAAVTDSSLEIGGESHQIVGVAPPGFDFPADTQLWIPLFNDVEGCGRGCHLLRAVGRLSRPEALGAAREEAALIAARLEEGNPESNANKSFVLERLHVRMVSDVREGLMLLLGAVALVLLIATANLANLLLARGSTRRTEISVRTALGASRLRLTSLLMIENGILALLGAGLGIVFAAFAVRGLVAIAPDGVPRLDEVALDARVLAFAIAVSILSTLLFGGLPAWRLAAGPARSRGSAGDRTESRSRTLLLVGEVALSILLLVGAGLLLRSFLHVLDIDLGFDRRSVASFFLALPDRYDTPEKAVDFYQRLETELAAIPGVERVGSVLGRPFGNGTIGTDVLFADEPEPPPGEEKSVRVRIATPGYFETLRIPLLEGRAIEERDRHGAEPIAVVNQAFVDRYSSGEQVRGRRATIGIDFGWEEPPRTIVGIVGDTRTDSLTGEPVPELFVPQAQMGSIWMNVNLRTGADPDSLWPQIRDAVASIDPDLPVQSPETLEQAVRAEHGSARFYVTLLGAFSVIAIVLAAIGLYGVVSYLVSRRTREIAVRLAVGASREQVLGLVIRQGLQPVLAGVALGLLAAAAMARLTSALLYQVEPLDPMTFGIVPAVLLLVALAALWMPARRASRIAPANALLED